jgi:hypothetical protein
MLVPENLWTFVCEVLIFILASFVAVLAWLLQSARREADRWKECSKFSQALYQSEADRRSAKSG